MGVLNRLHFSCFTTKAELGFWPLMETSANVSVRYWENSCRRFCCCILSFWPSEDSDILGTYTPPLCKIPIIVQQTGVFELEFVVGLPSFSLFYFRSLASSPLSLPYTASFTIVYICRRGGGGWTVRHTSDVMAKKRRVVQDVHLYQYVSHLQNLVEIEFLCESLYGGFVCVIESAMYDVYNIYNVGLLSVNVPIWVLRMMLC